MDMTAFRTMYAIGLVSYLSLIFFSEYLTLVYCSNVLMLISIGGWFNTILLIIELRVPHANVGSVSALTRTFAVGMSVLSPTVANFPAPMPQVFLMSLATFAFLLSYLLPPPGVNLPTVQKNGETSAVLIDKMSNAPTLITGMDPTSPDYPMTNYAIHAASFRQSYTERALNITRTHLNETGLDPDVYLNEGNFSFSKSDNEE